jgi:microcystin-dependent protein
MESIILTNQNQNLAINYKYVNPVGAITCYAGVNTPEGWLFCDGSEVSKINYAALYSVIGNLYGNPVDSNNFILPDLRFKFPLGKNNNLGMSGGNETITLTTNQLPSHTHTGVTDADGIHNHTGNISFNGVHNHTITDPGHTHTQTTINDDFNHSGGSPPGFSADSAGSMTWNNINNSTTGITINSSGNHSHTLTINPSNSHTHTFTTNSTGSGSSINIMNPYLALNYIIQY